MQPKKPLLRYLEKQNLDPEQIIRLGRRRNFDRITTIKAMQQVYWDIRQGNKELFGFGFVNEVFKIAPEIQRQRFLNQFELGDDNGG
jgi:hypothetical protein